MSFIILLMTDVVHEAKFYTTRAFVRQLDVKNFLPTTLAWT